MISRTLRVISKRFNSSTCGLSAKTQPADESSQTLRHLQFVKPLMPFTNGLDIQESIVRMQLDIKKLDSNITKKIAALKEQNLEINDEERKIISKIREMKPNPIILTFQFQPTYTGGKRIKKELTPEQIQEMEHFKPSESTEKTNFVQLDRGGQVTFHGPGQMVAYIILDLKSFEKFPPRCFVSGIEEATINCLDSYGVSAERTSDTGVWSKTNNGKLASIGVNVKRNITSHGICINVSPNLEYLNHFTMCGLPNSKATSIKEVLIKNTDNTAKIPTVDDVAVSFTNHMAKVLGINKVERIIVDSHELK